MHRPADGPTRMSLKGRIRQTFVYWCFEKYWNVDRACDVARRLGCVALEAIAVEHWPTLRRHNLGCVLAKAHEFDLGPNDPANRSQWLEAMRAAIDDCAEFGCPNVVTFTGARGRFPDDVALGHCVDGFKQIAGHAERKNVTLLLELLNSRAAGFMRGRPGYQGDHVDYCLEIIRRVGSPRLRFLFDIYHVQVMDGDVIRRIRDHHELIGHYHTAGAPGRCELDDDQEINYPPIMRAILETGYTGYVGHEFIPTRDPLEGLAQAVRLCDV